MEMVIGVASFGEVVWEKGMPEVISCSHSVYFGLSTS